MDHSNLKMQCEYIFNIFCIGSSNKRQRDDMTHIGKTNKSTNSRIFYLRDTIPNIVTRTFVKLLHYFATIGQVFTYVVVYKALTDT